MQYFTQIIVIAEEAAGEVRKGSLQTIGKAAEITRGDFRCIFIGSDKQHCSEAFAAGAKKVEFLSLDGKHEANAEYVTGVLHDILKETAGALILASASDLMQDVGPRLATRMNAGYLGDVTAIEGSGGEFVFVRPVYAGKAAERVEILTNSAVVTLRANAFPSPEISEGASGDVTELTPQVPAEVKVRVLELQRSEDTGDVDLTEADIVVSGGTGVGGPEGFQPLRELCSTLNAALGASRAAVHAGWIGPEHQVGQTGKTVSPNLYMACGISGAIQHQAGMRTSQCIVAINTDTNAPIYKIAHYGVAHDLHEFVPALNGELRRREE